MLEVGEEKVRIPGNHLMTGRRSARDARPVVESLEGRQLLILLR